jgi:putative transposase
MIAISQKNIMKYNSEIHKRRSIRLKGYDYTQAGLYFITICIQHQECLLGDIQNNIMQLNDAGKMIEKWYYELMNKFSDIKCDEMIIMPNHFHCIIENIGINEGVLPNDNGTLGEHLGSPLHKVVQWFKTMTTNEYISGVKKENWQPFDGKLWQRNYYEHIICDEIAYQNISNYIINNPAEWKKDNFYR